MNVNIDLGAYISAMAASIIELEEAAGTGLCGIFDPLELLASLDELAGDEHNPPQTGVAFLAHEYLRLRDAQAWDREFRAIVEGASSE